MVKVMLVSLLVASSLATSDQWVKPAGLPDGHNGNTLERLVEPTAGKKPHIWMLLFDDYGWADAGWHRNYTGPGGVPVPATNDVQTPNLNELVRNGIELDRQYTYKYCSPTRSALQSGRNPYHVNPLNADPSISNPDDPIGGFAAIPRNMTGIATKMAAAGYKTAGFGKWDAGMATPDHTPHGRGYQTSLNYFHHANDYWSFTVGGCKVPAPTPDPPLPTKKCFPIRHKNFCLGSSTPIKDSKPTKTAQDCCSLCTANANCTAWAWGKSLHKSGYWSCNLKSDFKEKQTGVDSNCTSACRTGGDSCAPKKIPVVDLWAANPSMGEGVMRLSGSRGHTLSASATEGPAHGLNNSFPDGNHSSDTPGGHPHNCMPGPEGDKWYDGYEDSLFEQHVLKVVEDHDPSVPLFLFYAPHIVHAPLQVPRHYYEKFDFISQAGNDKDKHNRQLYHAMVNYADAAVGNVTKLFKSKGMWDDLVMVFSTDNGGPIYNNGSAGANNYPLKGGKMNNWEGGIRGNAFVSGGFVPMSMRGTKYEGLVTVWDWYATFCAFAGVDPTDHRAALAKLPPLDSYDHSLMIMGKNNTSPRTEIPIGTEPRASNISTAPACSSYDARTTYYGDRRMDGHDTAPALPTGGGNCTTVSAIIVDEGANGMWKLLTGDVEQDVYTGPVYPNQTTNEISNNFVGHCANGCLYNIKADPLETTDLASKMPAKVAELRAKIEQYETTAFNPKRGGEDPKSCKQALGKYGGFWGPFLP